MHKEIYVFAQLLDFIDKVLKLNFNYLSTHERNKEKVRCKVQSEFALEALKIIYRSKVYMQLIDEEGGLYIQSPSYVYELLKLEIY